MREIRPSGSEGGARSHPSSLPLSGWDGAGSSPRDEPHQGRDGFHAVPDQTSGRTKESMGFLANAVMCGMAICLRLDLNPLRGLISDRVEPVPTRVGRRSLAALSSEMAA